MNKIRSKRLPMNLRTKLICLFLGLIALPLAIFGTLLFSLQQNITESFVTDSMDTNITKLSSQFSRELSMIRTLSNVYYLDRDLIRLLSDRTENPIREEHFADIADKYSAITGRINAKCVFLTPEGDFYSETAHFSAADAQALLKSVDRSWGNLHWLTETDPVSGKMHIRAVRPLHRRENQEFIGILVLCVQESEFQKVLSGYLSDFQNAYLFDREGQLLSVVNNQDIDYVPSARQCTLFSGAFTENNAASPQYVTYHNIADSGWTMVISSDLSVLRRPYAQGNITFLALLGCYFILTVVLAVLFSNRFVRPIRRLCDHISLVKDGDFDQMVPVSSSDEVGRLSEEYNQMLLRTKELLDGLMAAQQAQHSAEMQALQAQINPHFIYNTLASIRFLIFAGQNQDADRALLSLVSILRGTLSDPHSLSTVGQEFKLLSDYIELQRISFSRTLEIEMDMDESIRSCPLCKLTLQPIVENAFSHGFKAGQQICRLEIHARDAGSAVEISIRDNGVGFGSDHVNPEDCVADIMHTGLGIANVHERIRHAFGEEYGLHIHSEPGMGTAVHITIPKGTEKGDALIYDGSHR